jgi:Putative serine esterase (DUF676)
LQVVDGRGGVGNEARVLSFSVVVPPDPLTGPPQAILFVHGYSVVIDAGVLALGGGTDCSQYFKNFSDSFGAWGYKGNLESIGYYEKDTNCTYKLNNFSYGKSGNPSVNVNLHFGNSLESIDQGTSIRHLGYLLSWYIYHKYSKFNQAVSIVAHSMGGLISRYATCMSANKDPDFPEKLYIKSLITIGTPNNGTLFGLYPTFQSNEMLSNSETLNSINSCDNWTLEIQNRLKIGSRGVNFTTGDGVVSAESATFGGTGKQIVYIDPILAHIFGFPGYLSELEDTNIGFATIETRNSNSETWKKLSGEMRIGELIYNTATSKEIFK